MSNDTPNVPAKPAGIAISPAVALAEEREKTAFLSNRCLILRQVAEELTEKFQAAERRIKELEAEKGEDAPAKMPPARKEKQ